jgi:predicted ArsR family transcriptional regulator
MSIDPKRTRDRILSLLDAGGMTNEALCLATGMSERGIRDVCLYLEAKGLVYRTKSPHKKNAGPAPMLWCVCRLITEEEDVDEALPKRKIGYGSNVVGEALVKAWQ